MAVAAEERVVSAQADAEVRRELERLAEHDDRSIAEPIASSESTIRSPERERVT